MATPSWTSPDPYGRTRRPGGGPKPLTERQPGLLAALDALVDPDTRGDTESPLRWICTSTRQLADASGGKRKPAKAERGAAAKRGRRVLMAPVSLLVGGHRGRNMPPGGMWAAAHAQLRVTNSAAAACTDYYR